MSGFVGLFSDDEPIDVSQLGRMTAFLAGCGPDRQDTWSDGRAGLGHALLRSTFDSALDQQPRTLDGHVWIVADARVDDRVELRRKLCAHGRDVAPDAADVDLILHAYAAWGEECLQHVIGDFAFAIWDARLRSLFCARDHFGVAPFYYAEVKQGLLVSNVLNAIRLHPAISDRLNEQAIGDFLLFNMNMASATTTFADIQRLPAAHTLTWNDGRVRIKPYWDLPERQDRAPVDAPRQYVERFGELFEQAVGDRLRTDRAGVHLSGGLDSTSIAVTAHKLLRSSGSDFDLRAYTIVFKWLFKEEEGRYAAAVAAPLDLPVEYLAAEDFCTQEPEMTTKGKTPEPAVITNRTAEQEIARRVSAFSRVLLAGFGGDPLFSYKRSRWATSLPAGRLAETMREAWLALIRGDLPKLGLRTAMRRRLSGAPSQGPVPVWLNPDFARRLDLGRRVQQIAAERQRLVDLQGMRFPSWANLFEWAHPGFHGFPVRFVFPFFDVRLVRHVETVPAFPWRTNKRLLREAMRGLLPEVVRQRPKAPLYAPDAPTAGGHRLQDFASRPDERRWRRDLIVGARLEPFVDVQRALAIIESPVSASPGLALDSCVSLAHWLQ